MMTGMERGGRPRPGGKKDGRLKKNKAAGHGKKPGPKKGRK